MIAKKIIAIVTTLAICLVVLDLQSFAAQTHNTDVTLTIEDMVYTLTIPSNTSLPTDGATIALTNGLTVSGGKLALGRKLDVTVTSANGWILKDDASTTNRTITYGLYANQNDVNTNTLWSYTRDEANSVTGTTKQIYAAAQINEVYLADSGTYKDVITFTAQINSSVYPLQSDDRTVSVDVNVEGCTTWYDIASKTENHNIGFSGNNSSYPMCYTKDGTTYYVLDSATDRYVDLTKTYDPSERMYLHKY